MTTSDVLILGAGMAGATTGWHLARDGAAVVLLEREAQPGYHSTGRSAALYSETYGPPVIRKLSSASRAFLENPPDGFTENPLLTPRGLLMMATAAEGDRIDDYIREWRANGAVVESIDGDALRDMVPILREGVFAGGALERGAMDIDVAALHQGFLRGLKHAGGTVQTDSEAAAIEQVNGLWRVTTRRGDVHEAPLLINAAGAWADEVASMAGVRRIGLTPKRRTALMVDLPDGCRPDVWPMTADLAETFYFKPDAGRLLLSPADATPVPPQDVQPEIEDVATVIERFMEVTTVEVERPGETWAGLRSFVADGNPVVGPAPDALGFFWLAGVGGYGIQTAVGLGKASAALVHGRGLPDELRRLGIDTAAIAADRPALAGAATEAHTE